jgi:hypothetical protein
MSLQQFPPLDRYLTFTRPVHLLRIVVGYIILFTAGTFPLIVVLIHGQFHDGCNEANCSVAAFGWMALLTIPFGVGGVGLWTVLSIQRTIKYFKNQVPN